jgi:hypothetical protein
MHLCLSHLPALLQLQFAASSFFTLAVPQSTHRCEPNSHNGNG